MQASPFSPTIAANFRSDLSRWRQLVQADWLAACLAGARVAAAPEADWQVFEVGCEGRALYASGHIPGAHYLDTQEFERPPFWNRVSDAELWGLLQSFGLGPHSTVILYGRNSLAAARVAHLLLCCGLCDVRLLDGGLAAWRAAGHALETGTASPRPRLGAAPDCGLQAAFSPRPDYVRTLAQSRALLQQDHAALVSIRSHAEWMGETSGYSYIAPCGEIAGALWGHAGQDGDVNSMSSFHDATGRMKPACEIQAVWAEAGIHPDMQIAFYCGTGWRASLAFFYAWLMGWERISVFDGGWFEWSADPNNPVVCRSTEAQGCDA